MNDLVQGNVGKELQREGMGTVLPIYDWKVGKVFCISKRMKVVADEWMRSRDFGLCVVKLKEECGIERGEGTLRVWMGTKVVKDYVSGCLREAGFFNSWSKEKWVGMMSEHLAGIRVMSGSDLYCMKLVGDALGYYMKEDKVFNQQINIVQRSGKE